MPLDNYRHVADRYLVPLARKLGDVSPNTFSWLALVVAPVAGYAFYLGGNWLLLASLFIFLNAIFDALDGKVARISNRVSRRGDFLDHIVDRYSDVFIMSGIMFSALCKPIIGFVAIIGVLLTSYVGTQAEASGAPRDRSGAMGRADRLVVLVLLPLAQYAVLYFGYSVIYTLTLTEWVMVCFAILGNYTALQRFRNTWRELEKPKSRQIIRKIKEKGELMKERRLKERMKERHLKIRRL